MSLEQNAETESGKREHVALPDSQVDSRDLLRWPLDKTLAYLQTSIDGQGSQEAVGIFTERDMLNRVLAPNLSLASPIGDVATIPLRTAQVGIDGIEAARIMTSYKIKRLPLMEDQSIIGIVTARDLVEAFSNLG